jgi:hypothetical protein
MLEQQMRAEMEAEAWRRLREEAAPPPIAPPTPDPTPTLRVQIHVGGSIALKALVRFALGAFGAYLAYIAALDSGLGEFEIWLTVGATFLITLSLSMLGPARQIVHALAETARWMIIAAAAMGAIWLLTQAAP